MLYLPSVLLAVTICCYAVQAQVVKQLPVQSMTNQVNWQTFMRSSDLIYDTLTSKWTAGLFTGNGLLGNTIYMKDANTLRIDIGRTDVRDHRRDTVLGPLFSKARLPIGYFTLKPQGKPLKIKARLDIWDAVAKGEMRTEKGQIYWRSWTQANQNIIIFQVATSAGENKISWTFHPAVAQSPRLAFHPELKSKYKANPGPVTHFQKDDPYCVQPLSAGGGYTTAWKEVQTKSVEEARWLTDLQTTAPFFALKEPRQNKQPLTIRTYYISIGNDQKDWSNSIREAKANIQTAMKTDITGLRSKHSFWWHHYYTKSFISIPDPVLNSFYWIQMYKLGAASRKNKPLIDLMGPWMASTPWPGNWWNLNTELTYSPLYTANHLGISSVLMHTLSKNEANLSLNVPRQFQYNSAGLGRAGGPDMIAPLKLTGSDKDTSNPESDLELGDLTWNLYYGWLQYRYTMDTTVLSKLYPILRKNINYYLHLAKKGTDGYYHLPYSYSPEYPKGITRDANYALSLFKWGCQTLLKANKILNKKDVLVPKWEEILQSLTPYPTDENGLRIGGDVPFAKSHRHYSHLLMIYPLHLMTCSDTANRSLIAKSLQHWHSMPGALQGYSFTGGASIYALMGEGDKALDYLKTLIHKFVKPNTMYTESGPVIETPLAAATSVQELLLQSYNDIIRVFPAVPGAWADVSFDHLRTEGAFLISAVYKDHQTRWVKVKATVDGICTINPGFDAAAHVHLRSARGRLRQQDLISQQNSGLVNFSKDMAKGTYQIKMQKGEEMLLYTDKTDLNIPLGPVAFKSHSALNFFGKKHFK
jgi:hypothetical protein